MTKWYEKSGNESDVVISTRIRFARNLKEFPFECKLKKEEKRKIRDIVNNAILNRGDIFDKFSLIELEKLNQTECASLVEKHLVSPEFISNREGRALLLKDDESISIMINEEDHIRLQVMKEGFSLDETYYIADKVDKLMDKNLSYAFDKNLGYLTQCPTNLGTGMRASLLLHLPALQESGSLSRISSGLSKLGLELRGTYGEGTKAKGALYQLSNQVTLGISEIEAIKNLKDISMQLASQERNARHSISKHVEVLDVIGRSFGVILNAKILNNDEFMELISNVRLGIDIGVINNVSYDTVNALIVNCQPATLSKNKGEELTTRQRDKIRVEIIKEALSKG